MGRKKGATKERKTIRMKEKLVYQGYISMKEKMVGGFSFHCKEFMMTFSIFINSRSRFSNQMDGLGIWAGESL